MRGKYDFSQSDKNPYAKRLKQQVTMLMDKEVVESLRECKKKGIKNNSS